MSWYTQSRGFAAWSVILAFLAMFISGGQMIEMNPQGTGPWPDVLPRPRAFEIWLWTRNLSFLVALITGVFSLPRLQAVVGLTMTLAFTMYTYWAFSTY